MDDSLKRQIIDDAIRSWKNNKNRFNYMSLKDATTINELNQGKDFNRNPIYIKSNLDQGIIHFGEPSSFNDKHEFEFICPEIDWLGFLVKDDRAYQLIKAEYAKTNDFDIALKVLSEGEIKKINFLRRKLKELGKKFADKNKDRLGVFCLAPSCYMSYYWMNYCNNYNGICCEYDIDSFNKMYGKNVFWLKVEYSDDGVAYLPEYVNTSNFPELNGLHFPTEWKKRLGSSPQKSKDAVLKLLRTKRMNWQIELENRLVFMLDMLDGNKYSRDFKILPNKIYIGYNVSEELTDYFTTFCKDSNIAFEIVRSEMCVDSASVLRKI